MRAFSVAMRLALAPRFASICCLARSARSCSPWPWDSRTASDNRRNAAPNTRARSAHRARQGGADSGDTHSERRAVCRGRPWRACRLAPPTRLPRAAPSREAWSTAEGRATRPQSPRWCRQRSRPVSDRAGADPARRQARQTTRHAWAARDCDH